MPDLFHSLRGYDLGHLRIVAGLWGLELHSNDANDAAHELALALRNEELIGEMLSALPPDVAAAAEALGRSGGRIAWPLFARRFGDVREMGAGRRDREKPHLKPVSASEVLFYRGLLARAFFDTDKGPQEFAYVPDELLPYLKPGTKVGRLTAGQPMGRRATPAERRQMLPATDRILDEATTYLAALRTGRPPAGDPLLQGLLNAAGLLHDKSLEAERVKSFLEAPRREALKLLVNAWRASRDFNELRILPGLTCEGEWRNDPLSTRRYILDLSQAIPKGTWWNLATFVEGIKSASPDFQRPAGDYDSWFIKDADGNYLRGFGYWDRVDGALIRFLISVVMYRLGLLDLASEAAERGPSAFRVAADDFAARFPNAEDGKLRVASRGTVSVARLAPRAVRYQLARFCEWEGEKDDVHLYRITPASLTRAGQQGLKPNHLLALLAHHADAGLPPALVKALKRWEAEGTEARTEAQTVLRVSRPEIIEQLRKSKAAKYLGEPLGPTSIIVKGDASRKVAEAMAELGILMEDRTESST